MRIPNLDFFYVPKPNWLLITLFERDERRRSLLSERLKWFRGLGVFSMRQIWLHEDDHRVQVIFCGRSNLGRQLEQRWPFIKRISYANFIYELHMRICLPTMNSALQSEWATSRLASIKVLQLIIICWSNNEPKSEWTKETKFGQAVWPTIFHLPTSDWLKSASFA